MTGRQLTAHGHTNPGDTIERLDRAHDNRQHLHIGGRVRASDRDNIGTVTAIADQTGTAWIRFSNTAGATTHRWMHWADTTPIDHPEPVEHASVAGDVPVGHVTVSGHRLVHLFVDPDHQGTGLGRYLLELGESMIVAGGRMDFELHARVENVAAIAFYEEAGWTVTDRVIHTVEHGISYDERVLVKHHE